MPNVFPCCALSWSRLVLLCSLVMFHVFCSTVPVDSVTVCVYVSLCRNTLLPGLLTVLVSPLLRLLDES